LSFRARRREAHPAIPSEVEESLTFSFAPRVLSGASKRCLDFARHDRMS
jgi:hypothetical protein